jgi:K+-transporting ATPase ATPase A chain
LNPRALAGIGADGAMNTAIAFVTNTNWQWYGGESVLSNFSQMVGLTIHNFLSAATGIAIAFACFAALPATRRRQSAISGPIARGSRSILLPISVIYACFWWPAACPRPSPR